MLFNTLRPRQNGRHFPDDIFKCIFLTENVCISIKISLKFAPKVPINNIPALGQIMAWRRRGDMPLSEPMKDYLLMHICITWPQWVDRARNVSIFFCAAEHLNILGLVQVIIPCTCICIWFLWITKCINMYYHKTSNISRTVIGNKIVDHSDVVGASPVGAAPTTSSFLT